MTLLFCVVGDGAAEATARATDSPKVRAGVAGTPVLTLPENFPPPALETIHRWSAKTGKDLRAEIDPLKAEVAARKPGGPPLHPEFHKKFSAVFDSFIAIEVAEARERRNRYIHEEAGPILDEYREKHSDAVKMHEDTLNQPPYNLPAPPPASEKADK